MASLPIAIGCGEPVDTPPRAVNQDIHAFANGCYALSASEPGGGNTRWLRRDETGQAFAFSARDIDSASRFFMKASDLGSYLFYDAEGYYLVAEDGPLLREPQLQSDVLSVDDNYQSGAEWELELSENVSERYALRHKKSAQYLAHSGGLTPDPESAAVIALYAQSGCAEHPELGLDAEGEVKPRRFDDGSVFGIVDTHSHMLTSFAFGGGGIFHGAPFHRLGVEHALPDCALYHGDEGRKDLLGFGYDRGTDGKFELGEFLPALLFKKLAEFNHHTAGYPDFTDWPNAPFSSTHQTQYYRWLERAYLAGLRLVVQHATSNSVMCELISGEGIQPVRYSCNDMVAIDRSIEEAKNLERYIDAQKGGPGRGWFRIVISPEQARQVIDDGKLAVILGIEVSNLFDCLLVPRQGSPTCDAAYVRSQVQRYYELGVRAIFPVHKYDNAFSPGDGHRAISEVGSFANSGHWSSFTLDCPSDVPVVFDHGNVELGGLNQPRAEYVATPPNDMTEFPAHPVATLAPFLDQLQAPALEGAYCQSHGLTELGETLIQQMMMRGMIIEVDHLPQRSYQRVFEILEANGYPAAATHGSEYHGRVYRNGGVSKQNLGRCAEPDRPGAMADGLRARIERIALEGGYPAQGFGFDLNGFAGAPGPRFGERSQCAAPQTDPVSYPFDSYAGDVTFTPPRIGNRELDFNTEGLVHIGLLPELIEDARRTGVTDADLEPLFRSAEGYLRMWERAVERGEAFRARPL